MLRILRRARHCYQTLHGRRSGDDHGAGSFRIISPTRTTPPATTFALMLRRKRKCRHMACHVGALRGERDHRVPHCEADGRIALRRARRDGVPAGRLQALRTVQRGVTGQRGGHIKRNCCAYHQTRRKVPPALVSLRRSQMSRDVKGARCQGRSMSRALA